MNPSRFSMDATRASADNPPPRSHVPATRDVSVVALLGQALRRWRLIVAVVAPAVLLALVYLLVTPPSFTAQALVEVTGSNGNALADTPPAPNYQETEAVQTQVQAIAAPAVVNRLLADLSAQDREALLGAGWQFLAPFEAVFGDLRPRSADPKDDERRLKEILGASLGVEQVGLSAVIAISFTANDPDLAARLANDLVRIAVEQARQRSADVMGQGISPITAQVGILRDQLQREQEDARAFREANRLYGTDSLVSLRAQLAVLNRRLADARGQQLVAQSKVGGLNGTGRTAASADASSTVLASPTITRLRDEASQLSVELQSLTASLGERHPSVRQARSRLAEADRRLERETATVVRSLRQDSQASRAEEELLARSVTELQGRIAAAAKAEDQAAELDRKAAATEAVYRQILQRETLLQQMRSADLFTTSVRPISAADAPWKKSHPKSALILVLVATVALLVGLILVIAREHWSRMGRPDRLLRA